MPVVRLVPTLSRPPWGGFRLGAELGKGEGSIGESWEVWRENAVVGEGVRLGDRVDFPLLVKLLDTRALLSVQVHPGDVDARLRTGSPHGKAEAWVVLAAEPGARIAYGLSRELSVAELRDRADSGAIEADLAWIEPRPGDVIDVPPGTIHAIGPGLLLYEVQEPIDLTWRLYDWGRGRDLHLDHACAVAIRTPQPSPYRASVPVAPGIDRLLETRHFVVDRVQLPARRRGWEAVTVIEGCAVVEGHTVPRGGTVLVPPEGAFLEGEGVVLAARPGA